MGVRSFVALELPDHALDALGSARRILSADDPSWRDEKWVARDSLHITVKFMGSVPESDVEALAEAVGRGLEGQCAIDLPVAGLRAVPGTRRASMVWAAFLDPSGEATALAERVESAALAFAIPAEERSFVPHATLVRARRPRRLETEALHAAEQAFLKELSVVSVTRASFISSRLTPRGPIYSVLRVWELGQPDEAGPER